VGNLTLDRQVNLNDILFVNSTTVLPFNLSHLAHSSSNIQDQLNNKMNSFGPSFFGTLTFSSDG
jgi:hypothetical protein